MNTKIKGYRNCKNLLIIRNDMIGDFVLITPTLKYLRIKYSNKKICLVVQDKITDLAFDCPYIDELIVFNRNAYRKNIFYKLLFLYKIKRRGFSIAINSVYSRDWISDEIALWSCAVETIGWDTLTPNLYIDEQNRGNCIYTKLLRSNKITESTHELLINREMIEVMGIEITDFKPSLFISEEQKARVEELLASINCNGKILIGIVTDASDKHREWEFSKLEKIIRSICSNYPNIVILLIGIDNSNVMNNDIQKINNILDLRGKTKTGEIPAIISHLKLLIGYETGPIHIANALGIPSLCIIGGGQFGKFIPYPQKLMEKANIIPVFHKMDCFMCGWNCIYQVQRENPFPCIANITIDDVYKKIKIELDKIVFI